MTQTLVDGFLADRDSRWHPLTRELDRLIVTAEPALVTRVAYRMLMYHLGTDKARWVVAIDVRDKLVTVRFLWGVLLDDPRGILRGGTSTLMNLDLPTTDALDAPLVTDLVHQAVARYPAFVASQAAAS